MLHHLKIKEEFADAIVRGEKTFEIRINDRGFQKGDLIEFITVQEDLPFPDCHPIHNRTYEITYVMNGWGLKNGYVVFGIREEDTSIKCQFAEHDADGCLGYSDDPHGIGYCEMCEDCPEASINRTEARYVEENNPEEDPADSI